MLRLKRSSRHAICNAHRRKNTPTNIQQRGIIMKKIIVTLACCALIAPLAFAQTRSTHKKQKTTTEEPITVTGKIIQTTTQEGAAANYQPVKTLVEIGRASCRERVTI